MKIPFLSAARIIGVIVGVSVVASGQADANARAVELSQALAKAHLAWMTEVSSPGASISAKEVARQGSVVQYHLFVSGLPIDQLYTVVSWPIAQQKPSAAIEGASIGKDGIVMCAGKTPEQCGDPTKKDDPIEFTFNPAKGEPFRLALVAGDYKAATVIVPDPIVGKDKSCTLTVERLLPHFELAYVTGTGFPPQTEVSFDGESYGEKHLIKATSDREGNLNFALLPFVSGRRSGTTNIKPLGTNCSPRIKFDWGS